MAQQLEQYHGLEEDDEDEEIVMTPLKPKQGRRIIRIERMSQEKINSERVHYVAGGTYMGIIINKSVNVKPKKSTPHNLRRFTAHVSNDTVLVKEVREVRFWYKGSVSADRREDLTEDFFKDLLNPTDFPKDYMSFLKRVLRLVQTYLSLKSVEVEIRPLEEGEEQLDVRGQPITGTLSKARSPGPPPPAPVVPAAVPATAVQTSAAQYRPADAEVGVQDEAENATGTKTRTKKVKKKRKEQTTSVDECVQLPAPVVNRGSEGFDMSEFSSDLTMIQRTVKTENYGYSSRVHAAAFESSDQNEVAEEIIKPHKGAVTGFTGNPYYAAELGLQQRSAPDFKSNGLQEVAEEIITAKKTAVTGFTGNPYYAAELENRRGEDAVFRDEWQKPDIITSTDLQQPLTVQYGDENGGGVAAAAGGLGGDGSRLRRSDRRRSSGGSTSRRKSSGLDAEATMASKQQKLLGTLEDAFPTALGVDDIIRITKIKRPDVESLLAEMSQAKTVVEVESGVWIRAQVHRQTVVSMSKTPSGKGTQEPTARQHEFRMVAHVPVLTPKEQPTIAIITSLYCEKLAIDAVMDYKTTYIRCRKGGEGQVYTVGKIGKRRVVSTKLSRIGRDPGSNTATGNTVTRLIGTFNKIEHVLLVGVAGGVACCQDDARHVRLGDVVVSRPVRAGGPIYVQMDTGDEEQEQGAVGPRAGQEAIIRTWAPRDGTLAAVIDKLRKTPKGFHKHLDKFLLEGLSELEACDDEVDSSTNITREHLATFRRPPPDTDAPYTKSGKIVTRTDHAAVAPGSLRETRGFDAPLVHFGVVACGRQLSRDADARERFRDDYGVRAVDGGFQAVLESIDGNRKESYAIVRAACDYSDGSADRQREWRPYAALAAAAAVKCVVLGIVSPSDDDDDDD